MTPEELEAIRGGTASVMPSRMRRTVPIIIDGDFRSAVERVDGEIAKVEIDIARLGRGNPAMPQGGRGDMRIKSRRAADVQLEQLNARLEELHDQGEALRKTAPSRTMYYVVEGLPGTEYAALAAHHEPRKVDEQGKLHPEDAELRVNIETIVDPIIRACVIGHRDTDDETLPIHDLPTSGIGSLDWLLGIPGREASEDGTTPAVEAVPGFASQPQRDLLAAAAIMCCQRDVMLPLPPTRRSQTPVSDAA